MLPSRCGRHQIAWESTFFSPSPLSFRYWLIVKSVAYIRPNGRTLPDPGTTNNRLVQVNLTVTYFEIKFAFRIDADPRLIVNRGTLGTKIGQRNEDAISTLHAVGESNRVQNNKTPTYIISKNNGPEDGISTLRRVTPKSKPNNLSAYCVDIPELHCFIGV